MQNQNKLPYGQFYYIRIGINYYAGTEPIFVERKETIIQKPNGLEYKIGDDIEKYRNAMKKRQNRRSQGKLATYEKPLINTVIKKEIVGYTNKLSEDFKDVKRFRNKNQAKAICERLEKAYNGLVTPIIEIFNVESYSSKS